MPFPEMSERRKGQHTAVHRLHQVSCDLSQAWRYVNELDEKSGKKANALAYINESIKVISKIIDEDLGMKLIEKDD